MADYPYMRLWVGDYLRDTRHLSAREHGAYLLLLMEAWRRPSCSLPDDDAMLARWAAVTPDEWMEIKPVVMAFWRIDGRKKEWVNKKQVRERSQAHETSKKQAGRAASGWEKRKKTHATAKPRQSHGDANLTAHCSAASAAAACDAAREPERPSSFFDRLRQAANAPETGDWLADPLLAMHVERWKALGLTESEILTVTAAKARGRQIRSPGYLDGAMQDFAGKKAAPPLRPTTPEPRGSPPANGGIDRIRKRYGVG